MIILGVDPGIATTGVGVVSLEGSTFRLLDYGVVLTEAGIDLPQRLLELHRDLSDLFKRYQPQAIAVESLFFSKNVKTAITVAHARGVVLLCAKQSGQSVSEYTPTQVKSAVCGVGSADKKQVQYMVQKLLNIKKIPQPDDAADALAVAICHGLSHRVNSLK